MTGSETVAALAAGVARATPRGSLRVVARGRDSAAIWATVAGCSQIPAEAEPQIRAHVDALNRAVGWTQYDLWRF